MTLNFTVVHRDFVVQVSDRRFTYPSGSVADDSANKALLLQCCDANLAITYTGYGAIPRPAGGRPLRIDDWLAETLQDARAPELHAADIPPLIARATEDLFLSFRVDPAVHAFVISGWVERRPRNPDPELWTVTNELTLLENRKDFEVLHRKCRNGTLYGAGSVRAVTRPVRRRLAAGLRTAHSIDEVVAATVSAIRNASDESGGTSIGKDCTAVALTRFGNVGAASYPLSGSVELFGPHLLWGSGNRSYLVADPICSPGMGMLFGAENRPITLFPGRLSARISSRQPKGQATGRVRLGQLSKGPPPREPNARQVVLGVVPID